MIDRKYLAAGAVLLMTVSATGCRGGSGVAVGETDTSAGTATTAAPTTTSAGTAATTESSTAESGTAGTTGTASSDSSADGTAAAVTCPATTDGLTADSIKIGDTVPLSGPVAAYSSIPKGIDAWFKHLNDTDGGFKMSDGSTLKIDFKFLDDQYTPTKAVENAKQLVESDKVFMMFNTLGTANNMAIRQYLNDKQVPQAFVATGASTWGKQRGEFPWTIGYQADYESEGIAYAKYILQENPDAKIGVLYQNDDFGKDYLTGLKEGLGDKASQIVAEVSYEPTDTSVDNQVSQIKDAGADAFVVIAVPKFAIQAFQRRAALAWEPPIRVVSSVASSVAAVMVPAGPDASEGFVSSFYTKDPTDPALADDPGIVEYRTVLEKYQSGADSNDGFYLYGMSVAQTLEYVIESVEGPLCRESLNAAISNFTFAEPPLLEDGIQVQTGPDDAFPIQQIQLKQFDSANETWVPIGEIIDTASAK